MSLKENNRVNNSGIFLLLFFMYSVNYVFIPGGIPTTYIILSIFILITLASGVMAGALKIGNGYHFLFSIIFFLISFLSYIANYPGSDIFMVRTSFMYILISFVISQVISTIFSNNYKKFMKTVGCVGMVNGVMILLMLLVKPFQEFYLSLLNDKTFLLIGGADAVESLMSLRMIGITGFSAYATGFVQCLCGFCYIYYMYLRDKKIKLKNIDYAFLGLIMLSALVAARSSLVGIFLMVFVLAFNMNAVKFFKSVLITTCLLVIMLVVVISFIPQSMREFFVNWISEFFVSGTKTGSLQTNIGMYIYGLNDFSWIGDSRWYGDNDDYYMNTDVGWFRLLFSVGFLGGVSWLITLISIFDFKKIVMGLIDFKTLISICLILYVLIMMFKGAIIFDSFQSIFILLAIGLANKNEA